MEAVAWIKPGFDEMAVERASLKPIIWAHRPFEPNFDLFELSNFRVSPERGKIGDVTCVIIESIPAAKGPPTSYWLDPARDYLILRDHRAFQDQDIQRLDISYRKDPTYGWEPDAWSQSHVGRNGTSPMWMSGKVTAVSINQPIPAAEFQVDFPKGARVTDLRNERRENAREKRVAGLRPRWASRRV